ncbi:MAG: hypothetical protein HZB55_15680 [Deltaproteobacteria bacterium]|nr:hypothetical protein [Deltaproteobacteria bacterium]
MAQPRAVPAKIIRPATKGALPRERLFEQLDEAAGRAAVWLSAPAGSGKTTLVASYIEARQLPCLWYQVDPGDLDLASFIYYLGLAGKAAAPRKKRLPFLTPEYLRGIPTFSRNFFEELFEYLGDRSVLVLDNCHEVADAAPLHEALLGGMSRLGAGKRFIIVSRRAPPPAYARLRAHGEIEVLGGETLRLTLEEFERIARLRGVDGSPADLGHLHVMAQGWAAGLMMLLEAARTRGVPLSDLGNPIPEEIFDYFGGVVFDRLDAETRGFLLATSFLPSMTCSLAEELTGHPGAAGLLSGLYRRGDFTEKRAHVDPVYQYHPLFREFLQRRARESMEASDVMNVERRAGALLAEAGRHEDAAALLAGAGDWQGLAELAAAHAPVLLAQGRNETLVRWLRALPEEILNRSPWLPYWLGAARLPYDPGEAQRCFEGAFAGFREQDESGPGLLLAWAGVVTAISLAFSNFAAADPWLDLLPELVGSPKDLPPGDVSAHVASGALSIMALHAPDHPDLSAWEERALALERSSNNLACRVNILFNAAWLNVMRGKRAVSWALLERLQTLVNTGPASPLAELSALWLEGVFCWHFDDLERSISACRRGIDLAESTGIRLMEPVTLLQLGQAALTAGDRAAVRDCLERAKELQPDGRPLDRFACVLLLGKIHLLDANLDQASEEAQEALRLSRSNGRVAGEVGGLLLQAEVLFALGRRDEAFQNLVAALRTAVRNQAQHYVFPSLLLVAQMYLERGRKERACAALRRGLAVGREMGARRAHGFFGAPLANLCAEALDANIEVDYVKSLIRHNRLAPPVGLEAPDGWPWSVRVRTLGDFEVYVEGERLHIGRKAPRKPLDLLKALIAFGGRGVSGERLADALWPDSDGAAARNALETALHRLRKLLGVKDALVVQEGRLTLDSRYCWVDAHAFERLLKDADGAEKRTSPSESMASKERALALYQGPFLAGEDDAWAILPRERLRNRYLRTVVSVGVAREADSAGGFEAAVEWYRKGLEIDPLAEELYQGLIRCHSRLGRKAEALAVFHRCRQVFSKVLGVAPSAATVALAGSARD